MTGAMIKYLLLFGLFLVLFACSVEALLPEGCVTVVVIDEDGKPMEGVDVGIGFEKNTGSGTRGIPIRGKTDAKGRFTGKHNTLHTVQYRAHKERYYESSGTYKFEREVAKKWQPWNPQLVLVMRKIERPVPMYARNTKESKHLELPALDKAVGFDLVKYDWVRPYGQGEHADFIFKAQKKYANADNYEAKLYLTFSNPDDGVITIKEDRYLTSQFRLPRYAPVRGYEKQLTIIEKRASGRLLESTESETDSYIFRVRSKNGRRRVPEAMYGKILGGIMFEPRSNKTSIILFKYYLNPDHTRNLEFDPSKNLFTGLKSFEEVGIQQRKGDGLQSTLTLSVIDAHNNHAWQQESYMKRHIAMVTLFAVCNAASVFASSLDQVQFLKVAPKDGRAVIKGADGKLKVIKTGDSIADGALVKEIAPGRIVLEEKRGEDTETVVVTITNDRVNLERVNKNPGLRIETVAPAKSSQ